MLRSHKLKSLNYAHVNAFYESLDDQKELSRRYIYDVASTLRSCLEDAVRKGLVPSNQAKLAAKRTPGKKEARYFTRPRWRTSCAPPKANASKTSSC